MVAIICYKWGCLFWWCLILNVENIRLTDARQERLRKINIVQIILVFLYDQQKYIEYIILYNKTIHKMFPISTIFFWPACPRRLILIYFVQALM